MCSILPVLWIPMNFFGQSPHGLFHWAWGLLEEIRNVLRGSWQSCSADGLSTTGACLVCARPLFACPHKYFCAEVSVSCTVHWESFTEVWQIVYFVAPYTLSPDDLKPVLKAMLEYPKQREASCCGASINRKKQMYFWLVSNAITVWRLNFQGKGSWISI